MFHRKHPTIGLALGGGGSRGLAHIGVIKALLEAGIPIDFIAGTSIGALVGGFYAAGKTVIELEDLALQSNRREIFSLFLDPSLTHGFVKGDKLHSFLHKHIGKVSFSDLAIPFSAIATDLTSAQTVTINTGEVAHAIRASIAVPLLFKPVILDGRLLADGGMSMPVPAEAVRAMGADIVIAVNLLRDFLGLTPTENFGFRDVVRVSMAVAGHYLTYDNIKHADLVVSPQVSHIGTFEKFFTDEGTEEVIHAGEKAMQEKLPELLAFLARQKPSPLIQFSTFLKHTWTRLTK